MRRALGAQAVKISYVPKQLRPPKLQPKPAASSLPSPRTEEPPAQRFEGFRVAEIDRDVPLAVDSVLRIDDGGVADHPPAGDDGAHSSAARARRTAISTTC